jgi:hypothetical protein
MIALALLGLTACGKSRTDGGNAGTGAASAPAPGSAPAPESATQARLTVKDGGKVVPMTSAVAARASDGSIRVWTANHDISCDEILQSMRVGVPHDDVSVSATVSPRIATTGAMGWALTAFSMRLSPEMSEMGPAQVGGDATAAAGKTVEVTFTYKDVSGTVVAKGCGDIPIAKDHPALAKVAHPSTAVVTVAGQRVPIVAAWRFEQTTYLSSEPITCSYAGLPTRVTLVLDAGNGSHGTWQLGGGWFAAIHQADGAAFTAKAGATGTGADGPTVQLDLSGKTTIDGYPVELSGTIEALACVKRD